MFPDVLDKIEANGKQECFITLKDHKQNFDNQKVWLINLSKNEIRKLSKVISGRCEKELRMKLMLNQWQSTSSMIEWFETSTLAPPTSTAVTG